MRRQTLIMVGFIAIFAFLIPFSFFGFVQVQSGVRMVEPAKALIRNIPDITQYSWKALKEKPEKNLVVEENLIASSILLERVFLTEPQGFQAETIPGDKIVFGGTFTLVEDEILEGNLVVFGGLVTLETGSIVEGDVIMLGGNAGIDGYIEGEILVIAGLLELGPTAVVEKDVNVIAGHIERDPESQVYGTLNEGVEGPLDVTSPGSFPLPFPGGGDVPRIQLNQNPLLETLWILFRSFMWAAVAVLAILFVPRHTQQVGKVAGSQPLISSGMGMLTLVAAPILIVITIITIIGIPVALLAILALFVIWVFGVIALGTEVGKRLGKMFNRDWALAVSAGLGTFLLTLVIESVNMVIPCVGWLGLFLVAIVGIGAVVLTRVGTQDYPVVASPVPPLDDEPPVSQDAIGPREGASQENIADNISPGDEGVIPGEYKENSE